MSADEYIQMVMPELAGTEERAALSQVADHVALMGTMIAQTGLVLGQAMLACPTTEKIEDDSAILALLRSMTAGADDDDPLPVTIACYLSRAIKGDSVVEDRPDVEAVLGYIEEWARSRSYLNVRGLLSKCVAQTALDVDEMGKVLSAVRGRLAALDNTERE